MIFFSGGLLISVLGSKNRCHRCAGDPYPLLGLLPVDCNQAHATAVYVLLGILRGHRERQLDRAPTAVMEGRITTRSTEAQNRHWGLPVKQPYKPSKIDPLPVGEAHRAARSLGMFSGEE